MNRARVLAAALLVVSLAPGLWLRTPTADTGERVDLTVTPIAVDTGITGNLRVTGAWELTGNHPFFGGFSAMTVSSDDLLVATDRGWMLRLPLDHGAPRGGTRVFFDYARARNADLDMVDLEAMALDPVAGKLWTAYEAANAIRREDLASGTSVLRHPPEMADWSRNSGAETLVRLRDKGFIVIAEGSAENATRPALLYPDDPVAGGTPIAFRMATPQGYAPVDGAALPDGRVLIVLRRVRYGFPVRFDAALMVADPVRIEPGGRWSGPVITRFRGDMFGENFEGVVHVPAAAGDAGSIYVVSDDNLSMFQRTLLVRLAWGEPSTPR